MFNNHKYVQICPITSTGTGCSNDQYIRGFSLEASLVCFLILFFPLTEALTSLSAVVIHTQNITRETPGSFVDVLSLKCLQNKQSRCVCVCLHLYYICPNISSYTVDMKQPKTKQPPPPRLLLSFLSSPVVCSLLSANETDRVRLLGVFVALCQRRLAGRAAQR